MSIKASSWIWDNSKQHGARLLLLLAIADNANDQGTNSFPSVKTLAQRCRVDDRRVRRMMKDLIEVNELRVITEAGRKGRCGSTNLYELPQYRIAHGFEENTPGTNTPGPQATGGTYTSPGGVHIPPVGGVHIPAEPSLEPSFNLKEEINPSDLCSEPENLAREPDEPPEVEPTQTNPETTPDPVVFIMPLTKRDGEFHVTASMVKEWQDTFPGVDVMAELKKARIWCVDRPRRMKTRSGVRAYISGWMDRTQNGMYRRWNGNDPPPSGGNNGRSRKDPFASGL